MTVPPARRDGAVAVVGGGTMGAGIAQVVAESLDGDGWVALVEQDAASLAKAVERVEAGLARSAARRGGEGADPTVARARLRPQVGMAGLDRADLVVEAVPEDAALKARVLAAVAAACPAALVATNTSSLSLTGLASAVPEGTPFVGLHFFNPVPASKLVEVVRPDGCPEAVVDAARSWVALLGREPIVVGDSPGFATSRLGLAIGLEAIRMVEAGVASAEDIDRGMVLGYRFPIGPLELTDRVGLDVRLAIAEHLASTLGPRFAPPDLLRRMVAEGQLGQKSGRGFYDWTDRR